MHNLIANSFIMMTVSLLTACTSTTLPGTLGADRKQFMLLPSAQYHAQAAADYGKLISHAEATGQVVQSSQVKRVTQRLVNETVAYRSDVQSWNWYVNVLRNDVPNAYVMPGGKIVINSGMLNKVQPTDDELAAVLGHEIAHALREHSREKASKTAAGRLTANLITTYAGLGEYGNLAIQLAEKYGWNLPNSRSAETEADLIGLELMARAGYNPEAAMKFWEKMAKINVGTGPSFLSTHPASEQRILKIQETLPKVMPIYESNKNRFKPVAKATKSIKKKR